MESFYSPCIVDVFGRAQVTAAAVRIQGAARPLLNSVVEYVSEGALSHEVDQQAVPIAEVCMICVLCMRTSTSILMVCVDRSV